MRSLLLADLRGLLNLARFRAGRRVLLGAALSLGFLFLVSDAFGRMLVMRPELVWGHDPAATSPPLHGVLGMALSPGLLLVIWFGFSGGPRQLFEITQLPLWLTAPLRAPVVLLATWLRFSCLIAVWCTVVCGPLALHLAESVGAALSWWQIGIAALVLTLPSTAFVLGLQVVLMRFFSGRWTRVLFAAFSALGSLTFSVLLLVGALGREDAAARFLAMARGRAVYPAILDVPSRLLVGWAESAPTGADLLAAASIVAGAATGIALLSLLYRSAWANAQRAVAPLRRKGVARPWPESAAAVVFRKEIAQVAQQPGQLLGLVVSTLFVVVLASSRLFGSDLFSSAYLPADERAVFVLLATWLVAQVTIVPGCVLRVALLDGAQWSLYVLAPTSRRSILTGKLAAVAILQTWPAIVAAVVGHVQLGASATTLGVFALMVPAAVAWSSAVSVWVGSFPLLIRPGPERNPLLALVAVGLAISILQLTAIPGTIAWLWLAEFHEGRGPLAGLTARGAHLALIVAACSAGALGSVLAVGLAVRQLGRLTRPER